MAGLSGTHVWAETPEFVKFVQRNFALCIADFSTSSSLKASLFKGRDSEMVLRSSGPSHRPPPLGQKLTTWNLGKLIGKFQLGSSDLFVCFFCFLCVRTSLICLYSAFMKHF